LGVLSKTEQRLVSGFNTPLVTQKRLSRSCDFRSGQIDPKAVVDYEP